MNPPAPLMSNSGMPTHPKNDHVMDNEENEDIMFNMNDENDNIEGLMDS